MKKLITSLSATMVLSAGLVVPAGLVMVSGSSAQAASCSQGGYPAACPSTTTKAKAKKVVKVKKAKLSKNTVKVAILVKPRTGNVKATGTVKTVCNLGSAKRSETTRYRGTKQTHALKLNRKGTWKCSVAFTGKNAKNSKTTFKVRVNVK